MKAGIEFAVGKIGGSNMSQLDEVLHLAGNHLAKSNRQQALVVSAFGGVTNALLAAIDHIIEHGKEGANIDLAFAPVQAKLQEQIDKNPLTGANKPYSRVKVEERIATEFQQLRDLLTNFSGKNLRTTNSKALPLRDRIIGFGEDTAAIIGAAHLKAHEVPTFYMGPVKAQMTGKDIHAGVQAGFAETLDPIDRRAKDHILMYGGHIRGLPKGIVNAIGRSYSDTSAVDLAKAIELAGGSVSEVTFWKDVEALMTADPRLLNLEQSSPLKVPDIGLGEALEAARSGSSLLHVQALELAVVAGVNLRLKKLQHPDSEGTRYSQNDIITGRPFKTLVRHPHDALTLDITQVAGQAGVVQYFSRVFAEQDISVNDIASEGNTITFTIPLPRDESDREDLRRRVRNLQRTLQSIEIDGTRYGIGCEWRQDSLENIAIVGTELANSKGILGLLSSALSAHGINIMTAVHSTSQKRISFYVAKNDAERAYKVLHLAFIDRMESVVERTREEFGRLLDSLNRW